MTVPAYFNDSQRQAKNAGNQGFLGDGFKHFLFFTTVEMSQFVQYFQLG